MLAYFKTKLNNKPTLVTIDKLQTKYSILHKSSVFSYSGQSSKVHISTISWIRVLGCRDADPGDWKKERLGLTCTEVMKPDICWQLPYLLPPSLWVEEILFQHEKEGQMLNNNEMGGKNSYQNGFIPLCISVTEKGSKADLVRPQLSKLLKSFWYDFGRDFWNGKTRKIW